jgi:hypothetical protein
MEKYLSFESDRLRRDGYPEMPAPQLTARDIEEDEHNKALVAAMVRGRSVEVEHGCIKDAGE